MLNLLLLVSLDLMEPERGGRAGRLTGDIPLVHQFGTCARGGESINLYVQGSTAASPSHLRICMTEAEW